MLFAGKFGAILRADFLKVNGHNICQSTTYKTAGDSEQGPKNTRRYNSKSSNSSPGDQEVLACHTHK